MRRDKGAHKGKGGEFLNGLVTLEKSVIYDRAREAARLVGSKGDESEREQQKERERERERERESEWWTHGETSGASNPKARRVNWMECLSSQLAISNYSVSKWMEDGGEEGWF